MPTTHKRCPRTVNLLPLSAIQPDQKNPRQHSKAQIRQIAKSIEAFGFNVPLLIDRDGRLIAGHGRLEACRLLGWAEVPTLRLDHLSPEQARAFMIADNRLTENSTWDDQLLAESLKELSLLNLDFSLDATGFELAEIDLRIESLDAADEDQDDPIEPPLPDALAISRLGDLWALGPHRLLCGNALDPEAYSTVLDGQLADLVFTDPPYNVPIAGHVMGKGQVQHREFAMAVGEMSVEQFTQFLTQACRHLHANSRDGSLHYLCMDWRHLPEILSAGHGVYQDFKNLCVWVKDNAGMGSLYRSQHELVLVYKKGQAPHINNVQLGKFGRYRSNVWHYPGINSFGRQSDEGNLLELHPTVKPVALIADALRDASHHGDRVLDPFLGSGSTLIAAERTGRACAAIEIDPLYVDTAIRRWQQLTGQTAVHLASGQNFEERTSQRHAGPIADAANNTQEAVDAQA